MVYNPWENTSEEFIEAWNASLEAGSAPIEAEKKLRKLIPMFRLMPPSAGPTTWSSPIDNRPAYAANQRRDCPRLRPDSGRRMSVCPVTEYPLWRVRH